MNICVTEESQGYDEWGNVEGFGGRSLNYQALALSGGYVEICLKGYLLNRTYVLYVFMHIIFHHRK